MIFQGDMITQNGISYVVVKIEDGSLWGVSNNAEHEIESTPDSCDECICDE